MLYAHPVIGVCVMNDDLIDDSGIELGLPSREEMLKHQCDLLCSELDVTRCDHRQAHKNLAGVICMWRDSPRSWQRCALSMSDYAGHAE